MDVESHNGHVNGAALVETPGGTKGGGTLASQAKPRAYMLHLCRVLDKADDLLGRDWDAIALFARTVRDSADMPVRDRIRASELLAAMIGKGVIVAGMIGDSESPKNQTNVQVNVDARTYKAAFK